MMEVISTSVLNKILKKPSGRRQIQKADQSQTRSRVAFKEQEKSPCLLLFCHSNGLMPIALRHPILHADRAPNVLHPNQQS